LNLGIQKLGWKLDYKKFRIYLKEKYSVRKTYIFIGFVSLNQKLYDSLQEAGFFLKFKPTVPDENGKIKKLTEKQKEEILKANQEFANSALRSWITILLAPAALARFFSRAGSETSPRKAEKQITLKSY